MKFLTVHGLGFNFEEEGTFGPYIINVLNKYGSVTNAKFPLGDGLTPQNWENGMKNLLKTFDIDNQTIIVCHSLGTLFTPKFLAENKLKPYGIICIAGGYPTDYVGPLLAFAPQPEQMEWCKQNIKKRSFIYSSHDGYFNESAQQSYIEHIGAKPYFLEGYGHFGRADHITDLPILEQVVLDMMKKSTK